MNCLLFVYFFLDFDMENVFFNMDESCSFFFFNEDFIFSMDIDINVLEKV